MVFRSTTLPLYINFEYTANRELEQFQSKMIDFFPEHVQSNNIFLKHKDLNSFSTTKEKLKKIQKHALNPNISKRSVHCVSSIESSDRVALVGKKGGITIEHFTCKLTKKDRNLKLFENKSSSKKKQTIRTTRDTAKTKQ